MSFDVWSVLSEEALRTMRRHVLATPQAEVGGFILGYHGEDHVPPSGIVAVEAWHARGDLTRLTFTHDAWEQVHRIQDDDYPDTAIIGWYHSHPGHGIFLSAHDQFIQRHFFGAPWQIAVVIDPIARAEGMFTWARGEIVLISERAIGDDATAAWEGATAFTLREELRPVEYRRLVVALDPEPLPELPSPAPRVDEPSAPSVQAASRRSSLGPALLWVGAALAVLLVLMLVLLR
jgi:proteasome lid subunit RPN8/RPN11